MESVQCQTDQPGNRLARSGAGETLDDVYEGVLHLARSQHGVASRTQLIDLGASGSMIDRWLRSRRLLAFHSGVYAIGHDVVDLRGRWMAAVLSAGGRSALSHRSAGALWGICSPGSVTEVIRSSGPGRSWPGLVDGCRPGDRALKVPRSRVLIPQDFTVRKSIPTTSLARTLLDLASTFSASQLESAFTNAERNRLIDLADLRDVASRGPGWRGISKLRHILDAWNPESTQTRSELEMSFLSLCRASGVPSPSVNVSLAGFEVDCLWKDARLVVELDGFVHHSDRGAFERDRSRDLALRRAGYEVIRVTHRMLDAESANLIETILSRVAPRLPRLVNARP